MGRCLISESNVFACCLLGTEESCQALRKKFVDSCPASWVKHFDRKRNYEAFKDMMKQGYEPLETEPGSKGK